MKRSTQEITELVVFALIAILVGTLLLWGVGWVFTGVGWLFRLIAGFIWSLLRFIIPIAIVGGVIFLVVKLLAQPRTSKPGSSPVGTPAPPIAPVSPTAPAPQPTVLEPAPTTHAHDPHARTPEAGAPVAAVPPPMPSETMPSETEPDGPPVLSTDDALTDTRPDAAASTLADAPAATPTAEESRVTSSTVPAVDSSGFEEMDDLAEEMDAAQEEAEDAQGERGPNDPHPRPE